MNAKTVTILATVFLVAGLLVWNEYTKTPRPDDAPAMSRDSEDTSGSAMVDVSVPAELSERAKIGKTAFEAKCAGCHGINAAGRDGKGPPLVHRIYEPSHHSDMAFVMAANSGVRSHHWTFGNMPPVEGLTNADIKAIAAYVRELQRENGIF